MGPNAYVFDLHGALSWGKLLDAKWSESFIVCEVRTYATIISITVTKHFLFFGEFEFRIVWYFGFFVQMFWIFSILLLLKLGKLYSWCLHSNMNDSSYRLGSVTIISSADFTGNFVRIPPGAWSPHQLEKLLSQNRDLVLVQFMMLWDSESFIVAKMRNGSTICSITLTVTSFFLSLFDSVFHLFFCPFLYRSKI